MSKHHSSSCDCCCKPANSSGGYGYGAVYGGDSNCTGGVKWIYALLVLIVIVLQFGKNTKPALLASNACSDTVVSPVSTGLLGNEGIIDNSVLFIIIIFLLVLSSGCLTGGNSCFGATQYNSFGGYNY